MARARVARALWLALAVASAAACGGASAPVGSTPAPSGNEESLRLDARPGPVERERCSPGRHTLRTGGGRAALLRVPPGGAGRARALVLALHGAGGKPADGLWAFRAADDDGETILLAPASGGRSWSLPGDLERIDRALARAFARCRVDPGRVAVGGHSAGASLAIVLGVANGDLFGSAVAFSPGDVALPEPHGRPRLFVVHGRRDAVIPIEAGGDAIVGELRSRGYSVAYRRHGGGHEVPRAASEAAVRWLRRGW